MYLLVLGLALWIGPHMFKRLAPARASAMVEKQRKTMVAILALVAIILMVQGYRQWDAATLYQLPDWTRHLNSLLMVVAVYLMAAAGMKTAVTRIIRHPQMTAVILWSVAHLLVNGDGASIVLFGVLLVWAVAQILIENAQSGWLPPRKAPMGKEIGAIVGTVLVVAVIAFIHTWLGHPAFGG